MATLCIFLDTGETQWVIRSHVGYLSWEEDPRDSPYASAQMANVNTSPSNQTPSMDKDYDSTNARKPA
jgi:hypothetical protein